MTKNLVLIFGPPAVGKMTVGKELEKLTGFNLFHNHMAIELSLKFFSYSDDSHSRIVEGIRDLVFREFINSNKNGIIFTFVWHLDEDYGKKYIRYLEGLGYNVYLVELHTDKETLFRRNRNPSRIAEKPSKIDIKSSECHLNDILTTKKVNSSPFDFMLQHHNKYLCIDNTHVTPDTVANIINWHFFIKSNHNKTNSLF